MIQYRLDQNHHAGSEHIRAIAGTCRYVIASGLDRPWPVVEHKDDDRAKFMRFRTLQGARAGLRQARLRSRLPELHIYDLDRQAP